MAPKKEWSDAEASKLSAYFPTLSDIELRNPALVSDDDGSTIRVADIRERILKTLSFVNKKPKNALLNVTQQIEKQSVVDLCLKLDSIPKTNDNVFAEFIKIQDNPKVRFWHSDVKNGKLYPPRMIVDLSGESIQPNESVMINTGYVVRMPQATQARSVQKDRVVKDGSSIVKQPNFIIVPLINSSTATMVPTIYARDSDDTGLLTINFTLVSGKPGKIQVVFNAYVVDRMLDGVQLADPEPNATLFKPKDGLSGRYVKNPKAKINFNEMRVDGDGTFVFPTFNSLVKPTVTYEKQRVVCQLSNPLLLCSRRREWCNPDLVTLSGLLINSDNYAAPKTFSVSDIFKNTHCMVSIKNRITLLSESSTSNVMSLKLINGSFSHVPNFSELSTDYSRLLFTLQALASGYARCKTISQRLSVPLEKVLRVFDYHRTVSEATLKDYLELDDAALFNSRVGTASAYSVIIDKTFKNLAKWYKECVASEDDSTSEPQAKKMRLE